MPRYDRKDFIINHELNDSAPTLKLFVTDFIHHINSNNFDLTTWSLLSSQMTAWFDEIGPETEIRLAALGIEKACFKQNINSRKNLQNYIIRLSKTAKETFISNFLVDRLCHYLNETQSQVENLQDYDPSLFYTDMANALSIKLYHVDENLVATGHIPSVLIANDLTKPIQSYLALLQSGQERETQHAGSIFQITQTALIEEIPAQSDPSWFPKKTKELFAYIFGASSEKKPTACISVISRDETKFFNQIITSRIPAVDAQLDILFAIRKTIKNKTTSINTLSQFSQYKGNQQQKENFSKVIHFWFPTKAIRQEPLKALKPVIDFAIQQIRIMDGAKNSRFMVGKYPKEVEDSIDIFLQLKSATYVEMYNTTKLACSKLDNKALQEALSNIVDQVLIVACKERILNKNSQLLKEATDTFTYIKNLVDPINKKEIKNCNDYFDPIEKVMGKIKKSYSGIQGSLRFLRIRFSNWWRNSIFGGHSNDKVVIDSLPETNIVDLESGVNLLKKTLDANHPFALANHGFILNENISDDPKAEKINLFNKLLYTSRKEEGAKPGGNYDMLGSDGIQRRFMIKQGGKLDKPRLGETLAELYGYLLNKESIHTHNEHLHSAVTYLTAKAPLAKEYKDLEDFGNNVFAVSQYYDCYKSFPAFNMAGFAERHRNAQSRFPEMYSELIALNNECKLGLEYALDDAFKMCDFDFHSGNVILNFDFNKINSHIVRSQAMQLTDELELLIQERIQNRSKIEIQNMMQEFSEDPADQEVYSKKIIAKIKAIQALDGKIFFQKIDHGFACYDYNNKKIRLDSSSTSISGPHGLQPTLHTTEWTQDEYGPALFLSDVACDIAMKNSVELEISHLEKASAAFFKRLHELSYDFSGKNPYREEAEFYLLNNFYNHVMSNKYFHREKGVSLENSIVAIKRELVDCIKVNRLRIMSSYDNDCLKVLSNLIKADKAREPQVKLYKCLIERRNKSASQVHKNGNRYLSNQSKSSLLAKSQVPVAERDTLSMPLLTRCR